MKYKCLCGAEHEISIPDAAVVERFNELVKEGKVFIHYGNPGGAYEINANSIFILRPTPRYRPYNVSDEFKVDEFDGLEIYRKGTNDRQERVSAIRCGGFICVSGRDISWDEAAKEWIVKDTGEPFGQKVSE